jgi:hypothetical protein
MKFRGIRAVPVSVWIVLVIQELLTTAPNLFDPDGRFFVDMDREDDVESPPEQIWFTWQREYDLLSFGFLNCSFVTGMRPFKRPEPLIAFLSYEHAVVVRALYERQFSSECDQDGVNPTCWRVYGNDPLPFQGGGCHIESVEQVCRCHFNLQSEQIKNIYQR